MQKNQYKRMNDFEKKHWWFKAKRQFIKQVLPKRNNLKILDLGCGTGETSLFLDNWGQTDRIESSPYAQLYLKSKNINFTKGNMEEIEFKDNTYDLVCLLDVLYHKNIKNIGLVISKAYKALKKDGSLLITDSAFPFLFSKHDRNMHARERFYLAELTEIVKKTKFIILRKSYIYFILFPLFLVSRIVNKYFQFETVNEIHPIFNEILYKVCVFEAHLFKHVNYPFGSSVLIFAKKP